MVGHATFYDTQFTSSAWSAIDYMPAMKSKTKIYFHERTGGEGGAATIAPNADGVGSLAGSFSLCVSGETRFLSPLSVNRGGRWANFSSQCWS